MRIDKSGKYLLVTIVKKVQENIFQLHRIKNSDLDFAIKVNDSKSDTSTYLSVLYHLSESHFI